MLPSFLTTESGGTSPSLENRIGLRLDHGRPPARFSEPADISAPGLSRTWRSPAVGDGPEISEAAGSSQAVVSPERTASARSQAAHDLQSPDLRGPPGADADSMVVVDTARFGPHLLGAAILRPYCSPGSGGGRAAPGQQEGLRVAGDEDRFVQLHFTTDADLHSGKDFFRYRLWGYDDDWQEAGDRRVATYVYLPLGDYVFEVQAADAGGRWNLPGTVFRFSLVAHFYESRWFFGTCLLVLQAGALGLARHHFRSNEQRLRGDRLALEQERSRIARDLHDDLGSNLTGLAIQAEIAGTTLSGPGAEELRRFAVTTRGLAQRLREVIWAVDPESDTLESLTAFLGQQTDQMLGPTRLRYRFEVPPHLPLLRLRAGTRHQLAMSAREALNNTLKYSQATEVHVRLALTDETLSISIQDNGVGLPTGSVTASGRPVLGGTGLKNIRRRLLSLGGSFRVSSASGTGTLVRLEVPLAAVAAVESKTEESAHEHQSRSR